MADLDELADGLYAVPPADFVTARQDAVAAARAEGDKAAATALAALRKPTVPAWLLNMLVRAHLPDLEAAIALGADLRDATTAGDRDALRELSSRRAELVTGLVESARAIAEEHGQPTSAETQREIEATITTAAIDPAAADLLRTGRLVAPLAVEGFGFDQGALPPPRDPAAPPRTTPTPPAPRARPSTAVESPSSDSSDTVIIRGRRSSGRATSDAAASPAPPGRSAPGRSAAVASAQPAPMVDEARARAVAEAEQALAEARLQQADADAELANAERVLEEATAGEGEAAAAYEQAQAALVDARADVRDARKDSAAADRKVIAALTKLEKATRPTRRPSS